MTDVYEDPSETYDRVTAAWLMLLGEEFHYGVFNAGDEPLDVATAELTARMAAGARFGAGLSVLDIGCGTGAPAITMARRHGVQVTGTIVPGLEPGINYRLDLPMDSAIAPDSYKPTALKPKRIVERTTR